MTACYWLIPIIATCSGWLCIRVVISLLFFPVRPVIVAGFKWQGLIPAQQHTIATEIGNIVNREFSFTVIEQQLTNPGTLQKMMPEVEKHIDHFLREKLGKAIPMLSMFIGDKTINQMKTVFMAELETMLPAIIQSYVQALQQDINPGQQVTARISTLSPDMLQQHLYMPAAKQLRKLALIGAVIGFVTGLLQLAVLLIA